MKRWPAQDLRRRDRRTLRKLQLLSIFWLHAVVMGGSLSHEIPLGGDA
jgi:hypothetical protein